MAQIPNADLPVVNPATGRISLEWYAALRRIVDEIAAVSSTGVSSFEGRTGVVVSASGDYTASEITNSPAGGIAATTVQAALNELDSEKQAADADLTALAALAGTGIAVRTGADSWSQRSVAGTANEIAVANGDGVAGNPTISLPATIDLGGKTSLEIPNSATPTVDADGEIAVDTSVTDFSHGILKVYAGEELGVVSMPIAQFTAPTNGHVVMYDSSTDEFKLASPGGSTSIVAAVAQGSISSAATLDIALGGADMYEIDLIAIVPATDNQEFRARFSQSSSYLSGASDYQWSYHRTNNSTGTTELADDADNEMALVDAAGNATNERLNFTVRVFRPSAAAFPKQIWWIGGGRLQNALMYTVQGQGELILNSNAIDGIRFLFASGNIASGYYAVRSYSFT
jgi:hypothetical protein